MCVHGGDEEIHGKKERESEVRGMSIVPWVRSRSMPSLDTNTSCVDTPTAAIIMPLNQIYGEETSAHHHHIIIQKELELENLYKG